MNYYIRFLLCIVIALMPAPCRAVVVIQPTAAAAGFTYYSSAFNGTSDYLSKATDLTGIADGDKGLLSFWIKMDSGSSNTTQYYILANKFDAIWITRHTNGGIRLSFLDTGSSTRLRFNSGTNTLSASSGWVHVLASWDLSSASPQKAYIYINGVSDSTITTYTSGSTLDYATTSPLWRVFADSSATSKLPALISEFYFTTTYLDITNSANRDKFFNSGTSKPVDLGADGSTPTGTQPLIYLHNIFSSFETNLGSGGGFTENGTIGDGGADIP